MEQFINDYLKRGFGSMNKNDFEVFIFSRMLNGSVSGLKLNCSNKSDYEISLLLKIPITKVKRLRYEANLKYCEDIETRSKLAFKTAIKKVYLRKGGKQISFVIEDVSVRKYLDNVLKSKGRYADTSFNSEIVVISVDDLCILLENCLENNEKKQILAKIGSDEETNIVSSIKKAITNIIGKILEKGTDALIDFGIDVICNAI